MTYVCNYCTRDFKKESTLLSHKCHKRDRFLSQHEPGPRIGFRTFQNFYRNKAKTFSDYADSSYYKAFTKFGQYCVDVKVISPEDYGTWLISNKKRIDDWTSDRLYTEYLVDYLPREPVGPALTRAISHAITWSESNDAPSNGWLRYGNVNSIAFAIVTGRISGWALYNSQSGQAVLDKIAESTLLSQCWSYVDPEIWSRTFNERVEDQRYAKDILKQAGW